MTDRNLQRNQFWTITQQELSRAGYTEFFPDLRSDVYEVIIHGFTANGESRVQKYFFPRRVRREDGTAVPNYRSKIRRFIREELPSRNFYPPADHRQRQPGGTIAKINHDIEKKPLAIPNTIHREIQEAKIDVIAPPFIPEPVMPAPVILEPTPVPVAKKPVEEPLSTNKVLALFLLDRKDLPTVIEVCAGIASFRNSRPAPLRMTGEDASVIAQQETSVFVPAPPAPVVVKKAEPPAPAKAGPQLSPEVFPYTAELQRTGQKWDKVTPVTVVTKSSTTKQQQIIDRIRSDADRIWKNEDFKDIVDKTSSLSAFLSILTTNGSIKRVGRAQYMAVGPRKRVKRA